MCISGAGHSALAQTPPTADHFHAPGVTQQGAAQRFSGWPQVRLARPARSARADSVNGGPSPFAALPRRWLLLPPPPMRTLRNKGRAGVCLHLPSPPDGLSGGVGGGGFSAWSCSSIRRAQHPFASAQTQQASHRSLCDPGKAQRRAARWGPPSIPITTSLLHTPLLSSTSSSSLSLSLSLSHPILLHPSPPLSTLPAFLAEFLRTSSSRAPNSPPRIRQLPSVKAIATARLEPASLQTSQLLDR